MEKTLVIIKPDGVKRKLIGEVIQRFERKNLTIENLKMVHLTSDQLKLHYAHLAQQDFFPDLIKFMMSGTVVLMIISGTEAISVVRRLVGTTNAINAEAGTIRGDFGLSTQANIIHASDSLDSAKIEINRFFN